MISVVTMFLSSSLYFIFDQQTIDDFKLSAGNTLSIKILSISRKEGNFEKNVFYKQELKPYSSSLLKMIVFKRFADALDLHENDIVNLEILDIIKKE